MHDGEPEPLLPSDVDMEHPNIARIYDYYLGGTANWAIDREFGDRVLQEFPLVRDAAQANRDFLHRVVRYLVDAGVRQFVDIGAGIPTQEPTHEVAEAAERRVGLEPVTRVVYVDNDKLATAHTNTLLNQQGDPARHAGLHADLRHPDRLWTQIADTGVLDVTQPTAVLLIAVLHIHQPDSDGNDVAAASVARLRQLLAPGSYMAVSHATDDHVDPDIAKRLARLKQMYDNSTTSTVTWRTHDEITAFLGDFRLIGPGWTWTSDWRPDTASHNASTVHLQTPPSRDDFVLAGLGAKPR